MERLSEQGATVFALGRNVEYLAALKADVPSVNTVCADMADWQSARTAVEGCGQIDYLINNAGMVHVEHFMNVTKEHFDE